MRHAVFRLLVAAALSSMAGHALAEVPNTPLLKSTALDAVANESVATATAPLPSLVEPEKPRTPAGIAALGDAPTAPALKRLDGASGREILAIEPGYATGTLVVDNSERRLYLVIAPGQAIAYRVAIGKPGRSWVGGTVVSAKVRNPSWVPTPNILRENPDLPRYVAPGPRNPLGPRALYLAKGFYRIHGTNKPSSIGQAASNGCIRMLNKDVLELFERVQVGAQVVVRS